MADFEKEHFVREFVKIFARESPRDDGNMAIRALPLLELVEATFPVEDQDVQRAISWFKNDYVPYLIAGSPEHLEPDWSIIYGVGPANERDGILGPIYEE